MALAADRNPSDITTTAIAKQMGLSQAALFKHFPTKDAILVAVMEWVTENLLARVDAEVRATPVPLDALEALFNAHVEFIIAHPGVPRLVFGELQRSRRSVPGRVVQALMQSYGERVAAILARAKAQRALAEGVDVEAAAMLFIGTIQGLVMQSLMRGDIGQLRQHAPRVFAIYRRGIERAR